MIQFHLLSGGSDAALMSSKEYNNVQFSMLWLCNLLNSMPYLAIVARLWYGTFVERRGTGL